MPYHLISRFVDREWFIERSYERSYYLKLLGVALEASDWRLFAFAIMSNHIHLVALAGKQPLHAWVKAVHSPFASMLNRSHDRIGNVFVRGPKAYPVESDAFPHLLAYVHNNPVRANVCARASASSWTSHRAYIGRALVPPWLHVAQGLSLGGFDGPRAFDEWVNDPTRAATDASFTEEHYEAVPRVERTIVVLSQRNEHANAGERIVRAAAELIGVTIQQVRSSSRGQLEVHARAVAVHAGIEAGLSGRTIANALDISEQRVSVLRRQLLDASELRLCDEVARRVTGTHPQV
jgi:REP element-mobilizing transposase RayT